MPTPNIGLPVAPGGATDLSVAFNSAMQIIDALTPLVVQDKDLNAPPTTLSGDAGDRWIIGPIPTGAWSGHANEIALCTAADVWQFIVPPPYVTAYVIDEAIDYRYSGTAWAPL